jgi:hypothetical protein
MNKRRKEQLENLLDWENEGDRLPKQIKLFNRLVSPSLILREVGNRTWEIEAFEGDEDGRKCVRIPIKNTTLISLGLAILDGVAESSERYIKNEE